MRRSSKATENPAGSGISNRHPSARPALREVQNGPKRYPAIKKLSVPTAVKKSVPKVTTVTTSIATQTHFLESPEIEKGISKPEVGTKSLKLKPTEAKAEPTWTSSNKLAVSVGTSTCCFKAVEAITTNLLKNIELAKNQRHIKINHSPDKVGKFLSDDQINFKGLCHKKQEGNAVSPIPPNEGVSGNVILARFTDEPARKKTLLKARRLRTDKRDEDSPYSVDIFNTEYLSENLSESFRIDQKYIGRRNFLSKHNAHLTERERCKILNWILSIADDIKLSNHVYYKLVRLLDNILENMAVPKNMLQLVAIVTCWILMKTHEVSIPAASKISYLCGNIYSSKQILQMEVKLLHYTRFNLNISTPRDFLYFPSKNNTQYDEYLMHCAHYMLEHFSFDMRFSQFSSCELASAATYLAGHYLLIDIETYKELDSVRELVFLIDIQIKKIYSSTALREHEYTVYKKYSGSEHKKISMRLHEIIVKTKRELGADKEKDFYYY